MVSILIIEDDLTFSLMLSTWLKKKHFEINSVASVRNAKHAIETSTYDLILSDLRLPDGDGIDLLKWLKEQGISVPLIMMTSYAEIQTAVKAIKLGASDYIAKPLNPEDLLIKIHETLMLSPSDNEDFPKSKDYIEGQSQIAQQMYDHVRLVAPTDMSVLITGSSGTGKEYIARRIHEQSNRKNAPFIAVDCGAIPKELAASEFFGHIKGSFTGAIDNKTGAFVTARGGTIFLDEIGNLTYEVQVQLLRALQERKVKPIGTNQEVDTDIRLITATNENLRVAIEKGEFREDLYHRINEFSIRIPDLRERKEDILLFAEHFLEMANRELKKDIRGFCPETILFFKNYTWPGNLRQMKNTIKYATLLASSCYISLNDLPDELSHEIQTNEPTSFLPAEHTLLRDEAHERDLILKALHDSGNNKTMAARMLGIDRKTLYNKLKLYQLGT